MTAPLSDYRLAQIRRKLGENIPLPPKPRKGRDDVEHRAQVAVIDWWHHSHTRLGIPEHLLFAIPNGGWRDPIGARKLKDEGQRNGVCDLMLACPVVKYRGAFIEMKAPDGVVSSDQRAFMANVVAQGYAARVCYSVREAIEFVTEYLKGE